MRLLERERQLSRVSEDALVIRRQNGNVVGHLIDCDKNL